MVVFQVPAGMPEHNKLANKIGNYLEQRLSRELAVPHSVVLGIDVPVEWTV